MTEGQMPPSPGPMSSPGGYQGPLPNKDETTMAMLCHLLAIFTHFLGPLLIWLIKKDSSPFVDDQGKESLNFQITMLIADAVGAVTVCLGIGAIIIMAERVCSLVFCII